MAMKRTNRAARPWTALLLTMTAIALLCYPRSTLTCGPFTQRAVFTFVKHPDIPLTQYAAGHVGVLQPSYARSYLVVAYRYFAGGALSPEEQKAVVSVWADRLDNSGEAASGWEKVWLDARAKVPGVGVGPTIDPYKSENRKDTYITYANCPADAFQTAAKTLNGLIAQFGAASAEVKDWVAAQDQVFANCGGGATIPNPAAPNAPDSIRADRNYQIAAANFYAGNFDAAQKLFGEIANDPASRWRQIAPYLGARTLIRKATLDAAPKEAADRNTLAEADAQLRKMLADRNQAALHASIKGLTHFAGIRLHPETEVRQLAQAVLKNSGSALRQDLWDYTSVLDRFVNDEEAERKFSALPSVGREDDVTDWTLTFQVEDRDALEHSLQKWEQTHSLPWLIAAISKISADHSRAPALIEAADKVKPNSPAFASAAYHSLRLMIESEKKDEARARLEALLGQTGLALPPSSVNQFMALALKTARNLDEFLKYARRDPAAFTFDEDGQELPSDIADDKQIQALATGRATFDEDAVVLLNQKMPLSVLRQAAQSPALTGRLRREAALAVWVRAALLDEAQTALALAPEVIELNPSLKQYIDSYVAAGDAPSRKFAAIYMILKVPGARPVFDAGVGRTTALATIDNYRDNWWCALGAPRPAVDATDAGAGAKAAKAARKPNSPDFLTREQRVMAGAQWAALTALGTAPNYLCAQAISWAAAKPDDPRVPEALHLAVRATRYGCTDKATGKYSKQAYDVLHKQYPKSTWAQQTKYWFKDG